MYAHELTMSTPTVPAAKALDQAFPHHHLFAEPRHHTNILHSANGRILRCDHCAMFAREKMQPLAFSKTIAFSTFRRTSGRRARLQMTHPADALRLVADNEHMR